MAIRNRKADRNPVKEVRLQKENNKRVRWLTPEEEARLFEVLPKEWHSLVVVALHTGLRRGELLRLKWTDLNFQQRLLTVQESKAGEPRQVPMNDVVCETLREILRRLDNPYVFPGRVKGLHLTDLPKEWGTWVIKAGLDDFLWHDLRHTFASRRNGRRGPLHSQEAAGAPRPRHDQAICPSRTSLPQKSSRQPGVIPNATARHSH
jgi:integrase